MAGGWSSHAVAARLLVCLTVISQYFRVMPSDSLGHLRHIFIPDFDSLSVKLLNSLLKGLSGGKALSRRVRKGVVTGEGLVLHINNLA